MLRRAALAAYRSQRSQAVLDACPACLARQLFIEPSSSGESSRSQYPYKGFPHSRGYAKPAEVDDDDDEDPPIPVNPRVEKLAEEIMHLNLLEVADLTDILQKRLGISAPSFGSMPMMGAPMQGGAAPAGAEASPAAEPAKEPEKTEFDVKLEGFDAASKIKVIKEIRVVTELGLKEAKELVEKSPVVVKSGLKKEEADELKKKLEAVGGKVALE